MSKVSDKKTSNVTLADVFNGSHLCKELINQTFLHFQCFHHVQKRPVDKSNTTWLARITARHYHHHQLAVSAEIEITTPFQYSLSFIAANIFSLGIVVPRLILSGKVNLLYLFSCVVNTIMSLLDKRYGLSQARSLILSDDCVSMKL